MLLNNLEITYYHMLQSLVANYLMLSHPMRRGLGKREIVDDLTYDICLWVQCYKSQTWIPKSYFKMGLGGAILKTGWGRDSYYLVMRGWEVWEIGRRNTQLWCSLLWSKSTRPQVVNLIHNLVVLLKLQSYVTASASNSFYSLWLASMMDPGVQWPGFSYICFCCILCYRNVKFLGKKPSIFWKVWLIVNAAVHLSKKDYCKLITSAFCSMQWLPIKYQV